MPLELIREVTWSWNCSTKPSSWCWSPDSTHTSTKMGKLWNFSARAIANFNWLPRTAKCQRPTNNSHHSWLNCEGEREREDRAFKLDSPNGSISVRLSFWNSSLMEDHSSLPSSPTGDCRVYSLSTSSTSSAASRHSYSAGEGVMWEGGGVVQEGGGVTWCSPLTWSVS